MRVDSNIVRAIDLFLAERRMNSCELAKSVGVSPAAMTKWRKVGNGIKPASWQILFPMIKKYLPKERLFIDDAGRLQYSSSIPRQSGYFFEPKYVPLMIPVLTLAQVATYDDTLETISQLAQRLQLKTIEYRPKHSDMSSVFAVAIEDDAFHPVLPKGTTLFVTAGERPVNNGLVLVFPVGGEPLLGRYERDGDQFSVLPVSGSKIPIVTGNVSDAKRILNWIYPVLYYEVVTF